MTESEINYSVASGDNLLISSEITKEIGMVTIEYTGIDGSDSQFEVVVSQDNDKWSTVTGSTHTIDTSKSHHIYHIADMVAGGYIGIYFKKGSSTTGTITNITIDL